MLITGYSSVAQSFEKIYEMHIEKMGGKAPIDSIKTIIWEGESNSGIATSSFNTGYKIMKKKPDLFVYEFIQDSLNSRRICYDGKHLCIKESKNNYYPRSPTIEIKRKWPEELVNAFIDHDKLSSYTPQIVDSVLLMGQYHFKIVKKIDLLQSRVYYISKITFLLNKEEILANRAKGEELTSEMFYYDYRMVEGIPFAYKKVDKAHTPMGTMESEYVYKTIKINSPISFDDFSCEKK